jgi:hypothetical protein
MLHTGPHLTLLKNNSENHPASVPQIPYRRYSVLSIFFQYNVESMELTFVYFKGEKIYLDFMELVHRKTVTFPFGRIGTVGAG